MGINYEFLAIFVYFGVFWAVDIVYLNDVGLKNILIFIFKFYGNNKFWRRTK